ncbi:hypothetical protein XIS1_1180051 [Xenorhabdus innexi]|uniref:Uncharacterized protein n=1 Tax=Xenorhabdus innexi TaxID=290109 RepID=A0A1N6MRM2_9GAMM|nr:hypothetical protein XIS1_1180051 [Xenorhabdus innexi]
MLIAEGTRCSALAAAENDPLSNTVRNTVKLSLLNGISHLSINLIGVNFYYHVY